MIKSIIILLLAATVWVMTVWIDLLKTAEEQQPRFETDYKHLIEECKKGRVDMIVGDYVCKPREDGSVILSPYKRR